MPYASDLKRQEVAQLWSNRGTYATSLMALPVDEYGMDAVTLEPEALREQLRQDLAITVPQVNMDKFMGLSVVLSTNLFYTSVESFNAVCSAFNDDRADFDVWDPIDAEEAAWGITEAMLNEPPDRKIPLENQFSAEVRAFMGVLLADEGIITPPSILAMAIMPPAISPDQTFADDPAIFGGMYALSQSKAKDIEDYTKARLTGLMKELHGLPLRHRDSTSWDAFLKRGKVTSD